MIRILVIDDDSAVGLAIQTVLARHGYEVVLARSGARGTAAFETSAFDLVMVDLFMPGPDGLDTIEGIRRRAAAVPIVAISGFKFYELAGASDFFEIAAKRGATICLRKPFGPRQLMAVINASLAQSLAPDRAMRA